MKFRQFFSHFNLKSATRMWRSLLTPPEELRLDLTLNSGQCFRWVNTGENEWTNVLKGRIVTLKQTSDDALFRVHPTIQNQNGSTDLTKSSDEMFDILRDYFQLDVKLGDLYEMWSTSDQNFAEKGCIMKGIRMMRQDPVENVFSFICSSNNNISRITGMVHNLCKHYGTVAGKLDLASGPQTFYNFPAVSALAGPGVEAELRNLGFGYRAKYIAHTAQYLVNNHDDGEKWLHSLRDLPYEEAHEELLKLSGVGPKVADCICLMSLDQHAAIPVDTHVYQIAHRDYGFKLLKSKTLTKKAYTDIGELFRKLWGPKAGWAHSVLFTADLKSFQERLSPVKKEESADIIPSSPTPVTVTNGIENVKVEEFPMSPLSSVPSDNEVSKDSSVEDGVSGKGNGVAGDVTVKMEAVEQTNGNRVLKKRKFRKEVVIEESKKSKIN